MRAERGPGACARHLSQHLGQSGGLGLLLVKGLRGRRFGPKWSKLVSEKSSAETINCRYVDKNHTVMTAFLQSYKSETIALADPVARLTETY